MKNIFKLSILLFATISCFFTGNVFAQQPDSSPIYKKFPSIPPFEIVTVPDSSKFKKDDLKNKKATMIIVFSPDCDHCQHATRDLEAHMNLFKKVQIVMASNMPFSLINNFYREYKIANYPNIIMGMDAGYFLGTFFGIKNFPSVFLYDKKGQFVQSFEGGIPFEKIAEAL